jgi:hypothetical protein
MIPASRKYAKTFFVLLLLLLPAWTTAQPIKTILSSTPGAWQVYKSNGNIMAENSRTGKVRTVFSETDKPQESSRYDTASLVGPLLSVKASLYWEGGAHPGQLTRLETVNLDTGKSPVLLTDLFSETKILDALLKDRVVEKSLAGRKPKTIKELARMADGGCEIAFHLLNESFSFHHIQGDRVAVRIGLPHGCEVMRGNFTELGITLPIPPKLMKFLKDAERRQTLQRHYLP